MRIVVAAVAALALSGADALPRTDKAPPVYRLELTSSDSTRPVTARISVAGRYVFLGARAGGAVSLVGDTGSVTTPVLVEIKDGSASLSLDTRANSGTARLEVRPAEGRVQRIVVRDGGMLRLTYDGKSNEMSFSGDVQQTELRPGPR